MNRVLLLGGTGFIGSAVLAQLRRRSDVRVMALGHAKVAYRELEDINLVVGSLNNFDLTWLDIFEPDTIVHLARMSGRGAAGRRLAATRGWFANRRLIKKLLQLKTPPHVVYVSGTLVYGDCGDEWVDERSPIFPVAYARQYIVAERPWMAAQAGGKLPVTIVRPPWVVGSASWFATYYSRVLAQEGAAPCYGDGTNWMTFIDLEDCAGLILHVAERGTPGNSYNLLASGQHARQREFAACLASVAGTTVSFLDRRTVARHLEAGAAQALTASARVTTVHEALLRTYSLRHPTWEVFVERHLSANLKSRSRSAIPVSQSA